MTAQKGAEKVRKSEKTPAVGGTTPEAGAGGLAGTAQHPNFTKSEAKSQDNYIVAILGFGEGEAVSQERLKTMLGLSTLRATRQEVETARCEGAVILSSARGYYRPSQDAEKAEKEISRFLHCNAARIRTTRAAVRSAQEALKKLQSRDQISIGEEETWADQL